jgi:hypothetical protein
MGFNSAIKGLTNKEMYAHVKKPTIIQTIRLDYVGLGMYREWKKTEFPKGYLLYMNLGTTSLRGRPRNRWQNEVR